MQTAAFAGLLPLFFAIPLSEGRPQDRSLSPAEPRDSGSVALVGATVIDGTGAAARRGYTVVIERGRITYVGPDALAPISASARRIDLSGKWLVPGFVDVHGHLPIDARLPSFLPTVLAAGVTSMRDPALPRTEVRDSIARGELLGPTMRVVGGLIDSDETVYDFAARVTSEDEIRDEIRREATLKPDFIKLYVGLRPALVAAGIDEAHKLGFKVIGHLGQTTWSQAAELGIDQLTHSHIAGLAHSMVPEREQATFRDFYIPNRALDAELFARWLQVARADGPEVVRLATLLRARGVSLDPNLVLGEAVMFGDDHGVLERLQPRAVPAERIAEWRTSRHPYSESWSPAAMANAKRAFPVMQRAIGVLHQHGVRLTVGTDLENPWMTPGASYHRELELLAGAGISPLDVLTIATRNGAEALGMLNEAGTIAVGKRADLVVLGGDPVADIRNTRKVERVWLGTRELDPAALAAMSETSGTPPR